MSARAPRYPWLLPTEHPLYRPFLGFSRPMDSKASRRALAAVARSFARELAAFELPR